VAASRAEASGRFVLLELAPGADPRAAIEAAGAALPAGATPLDAAAADAQLAARARGDPWLSAPEIHALSYVEGRVVAARVADAGAEAAGLAGAEAARLLDAAREEIFSAVERVHAEEGRESSGWFREAWPGIAGGIRARCAGWLEPDRLRAVADALRDAFP
jgi:hypothetical protein